ncbi:MAG: hypothetical protein EON52_24380 [Actinomycetales bacterium]|nr:MAG: hypothetical protein EON52_24380 [Actinomycetales bacterium]
MGTRGKTRSSAAACAAALAMLLAACSGSSDADEPKASATPTPTATTPTAAAQPEGAHGVTYRIRNWDEYESDPVVLAYKKAYEGVIASANDKRIYPELRDGYTKKGLRDQLPGIKQAWPDDWSLPSEALAVIESVKTSGSKATVTACVWGESNDYRDAKGTFIDPSITRQWNRRVGTLVKSGNTWKIDARKTKGTCKIEAPS